jgi:RNA polymerase subunit RPABC4/transcription elongation factor Spt4
MSTAQLCSDCETPLPPRVRYCPTCAEAVKFGRGALKCKECSQPLEESFHDCPGCGTPTGRPGRPLPISPERPHACWKCKAGLGPQEGHCPSCGQKRDDPYEECPGCERPVDHHWLFCGACGDRVEHMFHLQERGFSCGAAAVRNALSILGIRQDEPYLREVMGSRPFHGTSDEGFSAGAHAFGLEHEHIVEGDTARLAAEVNGGHPVVVDWRHGQHYVCVMAVTQHHVFFVDSNPRDSGAVRMLTHGRFNEMWWDDDDVSKRHHAMHVFRRPVRK